MTKRKPDKDEEETQDSSILWFPNDASRSQASLTEFEVYEDTETSRRMRRRQMKTNEREESFAQKKDAALENRGVDDEFRAKISSTKQTTGILSEMPRKVNQSVLNLTKFTLSRSPIDSVFEIESDSRTSEQLISDIVDDSSESRSVRYNWFKEVKAASQVKASYPMEFLSLNILQF